MITLKPKFVYDEHEKLVGVILTLEEFRLLIDDLEDAHDYFMLRESKGKKEKSYTLEEAKAALFSKEIIKNNKK